MHIGIHLNTEFSPFEVVYGRRTERLIGSLKRGIGSKRVVAGREEKTKRRMKQEYDKMARPRAFDIVLVKT